MTRIDEYRSHLVSGEIRFWEEYLPSINQFLVDLEKRKALIDNHSQEQVARIEKFIRSSNAPLTLKNNMLKLFDTDREKAQQKIKKLQELGFKTEDIAEQFGSVMCHTYQVFIERLKLHFVSIIDFSIFNLNEADTKPFGSMLTVLKKEFPDNNFIKFLDTNIRNSVTHYSYFFENGNLVLCNGYFDESPKTLTLAKFMIESKNLNILIDTFFLLFLDKYRAPITPGEPVVLK
jgi:hypothetical protein